MGYAIAVAVAAACAGPFARTLKHRGGLCYALAAVAVSVDLFIRAAGFSAGLPGVGDGLIAYALFVVIMATGAFKPGSAVRIRLKQIRQPLAIVACIMAAGHCAVFFATLSALSVGARLVCVILLVLLAILGLTSPTFVVDRMRQAVWKRIHAAAYVFFVASCVHAACMSSSMLHAAAYMGIAIVYALLRVRRWRSS